MIDTGVRAIDVAEAGMGYTETPTVTIPQATKDGSAVGTQATATPVQGTSVATAVAVPVTATAVATPVVATPPVARAMAV